MNEETTIPTEEVSDLGTEPVTSPYETEAAETGDGSVTEETYEISETLADLPTEELVLEDGSEATEETVSVVTTEVVYDAVLTVAHADLFGSFLICGTLVGLALLRKVYGT